MSGRREERKEGGDARWRQKQGEEVRREGGVTHIEGGEGGERQRETVEEMVGGGNECEKCNSGFLTVQKAEEGSRGPDP